MSPGGSPGRTLPRFVSWPVDAAVTLTLWTSENIDKLLDTNKVYKNYKKGKEKSFILLKTNGKNFVTVVEIVERNGRNEIATIMIAPQSTIKKLEPFKIQVEPGTTPKRPSGPIEVGSIPSSEGPMPERGFSALQADKSIPPPAPIVKEENGELFQEEKKAGETSEGISDFGEKIGGARKDTAEKGFTKTKVEKKVTTEPAWRSKYVVAEKVDKSGWTIIPKDAPRWMSFERGQDFATKEEAEKAIPIYAVAQNHRVHQNKDKQWEIFKIVTNRKLFKVVNKTFAERPAGNLYARRCLATDLSGLCLDQSIRPTSGCHFRSKQQGGEYELDTKQHRCHPPCRLRWKAWTGKVR